MLIKRMNIFFLVIQNLHIWLREYLTDRKIPGQLDYLFNILIRKLKLKSNEV